MKNVRNDPFTLKRDRMSMLEDSTDLFQIPKLYQMDDNFCRDSMRMKFLIFR